MRICVSACLLGERVKYNGGDNLVPGLVSRLSGHEILPVCPEVAGGLSVPRPPVELARGRVRTVDGADVSAAFRAGVDAALAALDLDGTGIDLAILQSRSPTCGVNQIYDGTFTGRLIPGQGLFAAELARRGIRVVDAADLDDLEL
ncbi:MAG: DUF523 domain-containing protein [Collinsella sp.]|nr:DUF523 domain-containing protein [Collinsella sp.]